jgi:serine/threonine protein phosphatase PrpC
MNIFRRIFGKTSEEESQEQKTAESQSPRERVRSDIQEETLNSASSENPTRPFDTPPPRPMRQGVTQPLVEPIIPQLRNEHFSFGQTTDVGLVRSNNQDSALSFFFTSRSVDERPDLGLFIVADGMGGHHDGEKASAITTRVLAANIANDVYLPILSGQNDSKRGTVTEALLSAVHKANAEVIRHVPEGGTTVTAVVVMGDYAYVVHVGDSRAYLVTEEGVEQITRDHSLVQRLIELDQLTPAEAAEHPQKNVLYRALGQSEALEVDTLTRRLPSNSRLLICSDGLWSQLEPREIYEIPMNYADPQLACDKLVALANTRGGADNITAILLKIF